MDEWKLSKWEAQRNKRELGLENQVVILFPGHYGPGMGTEMMLQAMPELVHKVPGVVVVFACRLRSSDDWKKETVVKEELKLAGLTNSVRFYNTFSKMKTLISASDLVALPLSSLRNKLDIPTTLLEFMAMRKPVVISNLPPMNEIMMSDAGGSTDVGLSIPPDNPAALAQSLIHLSLDASLRERLGKCGQELVYENFNILRVARQYESLYQELIQ